MAAPDAEILLPARGASPESQEESKDGGGGRAVCSLCFSGPGIYTCPRCNAPYCGLACYRGPRHTACSEDFYRESVLRALREEQAGAHGRRRMEEMLLKLKEDDDSGPDMAGEVAGLGGIPSSSEEEAALWSALTPRERQDFHRLVKSGEIGALLPEWTPWWATSKRTKKVHRNIVELTDEGGKDHESCCLLEENDPASVGSQGSTNDQPRCRNHEDKAERCPKMTSRGSGEGETLNAKSEDALNHPVGILRRHRSDGDQSVGTDVSASDHVGSGVETNQRDFEYEHIGNTKGCARRSQRVRIKEPEQDGTAGVSQDRCSAIPPPFNSIPPLTSLSRNPSPVVQFSVVNALYGYAFSLQRHNGDLGDEDILLDFIETLLCVSGTLSSATVYNCTAHALQSAVRAASDRMLGGDQTGACSAMEATSQILEGDGSKTYSLAALAHTSRVLGKAQKLISEDKQTKRRIFNAKKKCLFLAAWVNENEDRLPILSEAVNREHDQHLQHINGLTKITSGLQRVWGGNRPPVKKPLIEEIGQEAT